ncbi:MAG TPA: membrane protein insertion efficiency factor YidD [Planctomicrobium sp.]|nr:membrane protein insertion efficiency factor YidD [Planctomicrobium sp.]
MAAINPTSPILEEPDSPRPHPADSNIEVLPDLAPRPLRQRIVLGFSDIMAGGLIGLVQLYRMTFRFILGGRCRFEPSCSEYFIQSVKKHGPIQGAGQGIWRICRCHPFCRGGYDPP